MRKNNTSHRRLRTWKPPAGGACIAVSAVIALGLRGLDNMHGWPEWMFFPGLALAIGGGVLVWVAVRGSARAASIEEIAARMQRSASKARQKGTTLLERHVAFDYYDVDGDIPLPHIMCLAMQDVIMEAELSGCVALDTPRIAVDLDQKKVHVTLEVLRLDEPNLEIRV